MYRLTKNGLGVVVTENDSLLGYLGCFGPIDTFFGLATGCFTPLHGHGTVVRNREKLVSILYQEAARIWVDKRICSHAVSMYAHDSETIQAFFWNGFGLRCVDAILPLKECIFHEKSGYQCSELTPEARDEVFPLEMATRTHLNASPVFLPGSFISEQEWSSQARATQARFFILKHGGEIIGYIRIEKTGETFVTWDFGMMQIRGAYLRDQYRGSGLFDHLMAYVMHTLHQEGYVRLGVDFESLNPQGKGYWMKRFTPYGYSLARRIDERMCEPCHN